MSITYDMNECNLDLSGKCNSDCGILVRICSADVLALRLLNKEVTDIAQNESNETKNPIYNERMIGKIEQVCP